MKILVYGSREFKAGFMKAQSQCGHQVLFTDRLPSAEDAISFSPDAVILMVQRPASRIQDCLAVLYESCSARRFLLFEPHPNGNCFFAETTQQMCIRDRFQSYPAPSGFLSFLRLLTYYIIRIMW